MKKNIIIFSLLKSFKLIKKNKKVFFSLFLLQLIFFSLFFGVITVYSVEIGGSAKEIMDYVSQLNLDDADIASGILQQKNILGDDPLLIYRNYKQIIGLLSRLLILSLLVFIIFNGFNWALTDNLVNKKKLKDFLRYIGKFAVLTLIYGLIIFSLFNSIVKTYFGGVSDLEVPDISISYFIPLLIVIIVVFYFIFISFSLISKNELTDIAKKTFIIGFKKAHIIIVSYLINLIMIGIACFLLYLSAEKHILLVILCCILFLISFIFSRIFLILVVDKLKV